MLFINIISLIGIVGGIISIIAGIVALAKHKEKKYQEMYREYLQQNHKDKEQHTVKNRR